MGTSKFSCRISNSKPIWANSRTAKHIDIGTVIGSNKMLLPPGGPTLRQLPTPEKDLFLPSTYPDGIFLTILIQSAISTVNFVLKKSAQKK